MKDGVIADFEITEKMLSHFIHRAHNRSTLVRPRIVIGIPSEVTQVEKRAVRDSALKAKASEVYLVDQAMAAAIGAGLPITEPSGNMVVDIGGGTTDIAVISLAGIVYSKSVRVAGNEMDEALIQYIKKKYNLLIGERTAEHVKFEIGSAFPLDEPMTMEIKGRDLIEGIPKTLTVTDAEIREALQETVSVIVNAVRVALERTPPELSADIVDRGIVLTGGGSLLKNLDRLLREETGLPVSVAEDPLCSVVLGTGRCSPTSTSSARSASSRRLPWPSPSSARRSRFLLAGLVARPPGRDQPPGGRRRRRLPRSSGGCSAPCRRCSAAWARSCGGAGEAWRGWAFHRETYEENRRPRGACVRHLEVGAAGALVPGRRKRRGCGSCSTCAGRSPWRRVRRRGGWAGTAYRGSAPSPSTRARRTGSPSTPR